MDRSSEAPTTGKWEPGSTPVFVVCSLAPRVGYAEVMRADLFGIVERWWVAPHPFSRGGRVDEEL